MRANALKALLLVGVSIFAISVGLFAVSIETALKLARHLDYWFLLGLSVLSLYAVCRQLDVHKIWSGLKLRKVQCAILAILLAWAYLQINERKEYKIMIDEPMQMGASLMMHQYREAATPIIVHTFNGSSEVISSEVDKRPQLFPFLVSILHDLTGYRLENGFYLNAVLSVFLLGLLFYAAVRIGGWLAGYTALALWLGIPEFHRIAAGAGFEVLNLLLTLSILFFMWQHLSHKEVSSQDALCLVGILAAYARYESALFVFAVGIVVILVWYRKKELMLSPFLLLAPVLLVPYLWRYRVFSTSENIWQLADRPDAGAPFSLSYALDNIGHAFSYGLSLGDEFANSVYVTLIGVSGLIGASLVVLRQYRREDWNPVVDTGFLVFALVLGAHFLLMMSYFFGQFDDFIVSRLSLPYCFVLVLAPIYALARMQSNWLSLEVLLGLSLLMLGFYAGPKIWHHTYSDTYHPANELHFARRFLDTVDGEQCLIIARMPMFWATFEADTTSVHRINQDLRRLQTYLDQEDSPPVYLYELVEYDEANNTLGPIIKEGYPLSSLVIDDRVEREEVMFEMATSRNGQRMSRVTGVRDVDPLKFIGDTDEEYLFFRAATLP